MAIKFGKEVFYLKGLSPRKSYKPSLMWSFEVTQQFKYVVFPLALDQWLPNMAGW